MLRRRKRQQSGSHPTACGCPGELCGQERAGGPGTRVGWLWGEAKDTIELGVRREAEEIEQEPRLGK